MRFSKKFEGKIAEYNKWIGKKILYPEGYYLVVDKIIELALDDDGCIKFVLSDGNIIDTNIVFSLVDINRILNRPPHKWYYNDSPREQDNSITPSKTKT
jgi:hypothetical protein